MWHSTFVFAFICVVVSFAQQLPPNGRQQIPPQQLPPNGRQQIPPGQQIPPRIQPRQNQPQQPRQNQQQPPLNNQNLPGQPQPRQPNQRPPPSGIPPCIQEIRQITSTCFQNAGYQLQIADAIVLNQTNRLPANAQVNNLRNGLCSKRAELIQCVVSPVLNKRGQTPCTNQAEFNFAENEMVQRMTALQHTCGAGDAMAQQKQCMRDLDRNMADCYPKVGLNETLFRNPDGSSQIRGAIIGVSEESTQHYCSLKKQLFECQRQVIKRCDGADDFMLVTGYDHDAMEQSIELLCGDADVYLSGLQCFQTPTRLNIQCMRQMTSRLLDLAAKKIKDNLNLTSYYDEYCQIRVEHLGCDIEAWKTKCTDASVGLKNEYECTMLPNHCKKIERLQRKLQTQTCARPAFFKHLRTNNGIGHVLPSFAGVLSIAFGILLTIL